LLPSLWEGSGEGRSFGKEKSKIPVCVGFQPARDLLIDYPWVRPGPWRRNEPGDKPEAVRDNYAATVIDLRRGIDLLQARSDVDSNRIAYVGHSTGAQWGAILSAIDKRVKAAVLMGGLPTEATILMGSDDQEFVDFRKNTPREQIDKYFKTIGVMDAINYVPYAAPTKLRWANL